MKNTDTTTPSTLALDVAENASYTYAGNITDNINLVKSGKGRQIISSGNKATYTGTTTIKEGTLEFTSMPSAKSGIILDGGTIAFASATSQTSQTFTITENGGGFEWLAGGTTAINVSLSPEAGVTADTVFTFKGNTNLAGNCNTLNIANLNGYQGKFEIESGKQNVTNLNQLAPGGYILSGGTLMMNTGGETTATMDIETTAGTMSTLRAGSNGTYTLSGKISGIGELGVSVDNGIIRFSNPDNVFSGGLVVGTIKNSNSGIAQLETVAPNVLGNGNVVTMSGKNNNQRATLKLKGNDQCIAGLVSNENDTYVAVANDGPAPATLTIDVANGQVYTYHSALVGDVNIRKIGEGTQIFAGQTTTPISEIADVTYTGNIEIQEGMFGFGAGEYGFSGIQVAGGATLGLADTILSLENLVVETGARILPTGETSRLVANSFYGKAGEYTVDWSATAGYSYSDNWSSLFTENPDGSVSLSVVNIVPEPSTWVLLGSALIFLFLRRRTL